MNHSTNRHRSLIGLAVALCVLLAGSAAVNAGGQGTVQQQTQIDKTQQDLKLTQPQINSTTTGNLALKIENATLLVVQLDGKTPSGANIQTAVTVANGMISPKIERVAVIVGNGSTSLSSLIDQAISSDFKTAKILRAETTTTAATNIGEQGSIVTDGQWTTELAKLAGHNDHGMDVDLIALLEHSRVAALDGATIN